MNRKNTFIKSILIWISSFVFSWSIGFAQDFPVPDIALTFDDTETTWHSMVKDISGNENNGYWVNYWDGAKTMYAKYDPAAGVFGGAWYMSGYHACCEQMASSSMDFVLLAGNMNPNKDVEGFKELDSLFHTGFNSMSFAFWHKSTRNYSGSKTPCPPNSLDMHEQELLVSIGNRNGIEINNFKGYYEVRIGQKAPEATAKNAKMTYLWNGTSAVSGEWHHIAITYDGADNGKLTTYIDGELAIPYLGDPNPVESGFTELFPDVSSSEIGAQNAGGLFGDPGNGYWASSAIGQYCVTEADTSKYRTGWPANGYFDDFVFYKNEVLTPAQILQLKNTGISGLLVGSGSIVNDIKVSPFQIYPNPSNGTIKIKTDKPEDIKLKIYNVLGALEMETRVQPNTQIDLSNLKRGIYIMHYNDIYAERLVIK